ncbi:hypothetical protein PIB30_031210, partial [Stylosanthes scabra]|nr:hypothetical protein [Stylosanthes scabra]
MEGTLDSGLINGSRKTLTWRRSLWSWEEEKLRELLTILSRVGIKSDEEDVLKWKESKDGQFSVKSFLQVYYKSKEQEGESNMHSFTKTLWKGLVPPRVELL